MIMKNAANIQLGVKRQETKLPLESNFISNSCMLVIRKKKKEKTRKKYAMFISGKWVYGWF